MKTKFIKKIIKGSRGEKIFHAVKQVELKHYLFRNNGSQNDNGMAFLKFYLKEKTIHTSELIEYMLEIFNEIKILSYKQMYRKLSSHTHKKTPKCFICKENYTRWNLEKNRTNGKYVSRYEKLL